MKELRDFIEDLALTELPANVYNQYSYQFEESKVRRDNLLIYLEEMKKIRPKILLVGEAPGYRGCRLTGVPFTSEHLLMNNMEGLDLFGRDKGYRLIEEKDKLPKEATATMIWSSLIENEIMALGWNSFPFHPHREGKDLTNRPPLKGELVIGQRPLRKIIEIFNIEILVAVGRKAEESLKTLSMDSYRVRHPAQGGKNEFVQGINLIKKDLLEK